MPSPRLVTDRDDLLRNCTAVLMMIWFRSLRADFICVYKTHAPNMPSIYTRRVCIIDGATKCDKITNSETAAFYLTGYSYMHKIIQLAVKSASRYNDTNV